ncbi:hypothetical protein SAMN06273572_11145 [Monaibacterium marinum]|uniref:Uncharacterized protein n=1 Tax=Pontivivens marinum TaxID=1690039 RepID=A0A2C9CVS5_9RHOB|nr:hypothetical protein SAMN06273572_11145 [Monaibacterium marinum]
MPHFLRGLKLITMFFCSFPLDLSHRKKKQTLCMGRPPQQMLYSYELLILAGSSKYSATHLMR